MRKTKIICTTGPETESLETRTTLEHRTQRHLDEICEFLACETPREWIEHAVNEQEVLLIDHANCEKKAANTALNLMFRHVEDFAFLHSLSKLAREELRHFEQVIEIMEARGIEYQVLEASRYAGGLRKLVRSSGDGRLVDTLIIGAFIEARSCERFAALEPFLDPELAAFYHSLLRSEARHYRNYLAFAQKVAGDQGISARIELVRSKEAELISSPDPQFRFHSGVPAAA